MDMHGIESPRCPGPRVLGDGRGRVVQPTNGSGAGLDLLGAPDALQPEASTNDSWEWGDVLLTASPRAVVEEVSDGLHGHEDLDDGTYGVTFQQRREIGP